MRLSAPIIRLALTLALLLTGCAPAREPARAPVLPSGSIHIGVAFDIGGRGDKSFSDSAAKGIDRARKELGVQVVEVEASPGENNEQKVDRLRKLADAGMNPVIAMGFSYATALAEVAPAYPNMDFAIVDDESVKADNIANLVFQEEQGSFLVGVIAAEFAETGDVGFIGGVQAPVIARFEAGFEAGVRTVRPNAVIHRTYLTKPPDFSGFTDPELARTAALKLYRSGAKVIYHAAGGSGVGVFQAARETAHLAIGVDSDQYLQFPVGEQEVILTSMIKRVDVAIYDYIKSAVEGSPTTGVIRYGLSEKGVDYSTSNPLVTPYVAKAEKYRQKLVDGSVQVPLVPDVRDSPTLKNTVGRRLYCSVIPLRSFDGHGFPESCE